jgi:hypothetical protein
MMLPPTSALIGDPDSKRITIVPSRPHPGRSALIAHDHYGRN